MAKSGVFISVVADASKAIREFSRTEKSIGGLQKTAESKFSKLSGVVVKGGAALKKAALPLIAFGGLSVKAFGDAEQASAKLANTLANNPKLVGENIDAYKKLATAIQSKTAADDESILSGASVLGNFNLTGDQIRGVLPLVVDYARKTGKDVPSAAEAIGKAMLGNTKALKTLGISYKATGDQGKDFTNITGLLRAKVGGFAENEGKTTTGRLAILKNQFNDLQEVVGAKLVGAFDFLSRNMAVVAPILGTIVAGLAAYKVAVAASAVVTALFGETAGLAWATAAAPVALVVAAVVGLGIVIFKFRDKIGAVLGKIRDVFVGVFTGIRDFLKKWGPLILTLLTGPFGLFLTNFGGLRDKIVGVARTIAGGIGAAFKGIGAVVGGAFKVVKGIVFGAYGFIRTIINTIIRGINAAIRGINLLNPFKDIPKIPELPGISAPKDEGATPTPPTSTIGGPQQFAAGGIVTKPTLGLVGEAGPEAIIPLRKLAGLGASDAGVVRIERAIERLAQTIRETFDVTVKMDGRPVAEIVSRRLGASAAALARVSGR